MVALSRASRIGSNTLCRCTALNRLSERGATLGCRHYLENQVSDFIPSKYASSGIDNVTVSRNRWPRESPLRGSSPSRSVKPFSILFPPDLQVLSEKLRFHLPYSFHACRAVFSWDTGSYTIQGITAKKAIFM